MIQIDPIPPAVVCDTAAAVFSNQAYQFPRRTLWEIVNEWLFSQFLRLINFLGAVPGVGWLLKGLLYFLVALIIGRLIYVLVMRYGWLVGRRRPVYTGTHEDPWVAATRLAGQGQYVEALQMIYAGILAQANAEGVVSIHDSKTTGDYWREFRRTANATTTAQFRDFTHTYERIVYGRTELSPENYEKFASWAQEFTRTTLASGGWR